MGGMGGMEGMGGGMGGMEGGMGGMSGGRAAPWVGAAGGTAPVITSPIKNWDVELEIYGVVYLFNPPDKAKLGLDKVTSETEVTDKVDVSADQVKPAEGTLNSRDTSSSSRPRGRCTSRSRRYTSRRYTSRRCTGRRNTSKQGGRQLQRLHQRELQEPPAELLHLQLAAFQPPAPRQQDSKSRPAQWPRPACFGPMVYQS